MRALIFGFSVVVLCGVSFADPGELFPETPYDQAIEGNRVVKTTPIPKADPQPKPQPEPKVDPTAEEPTKPDPKPLEKPTPEVPKLQPKPQEPGKPVLAPVVVEQYFFWSPYSTSLLVPLMTPEQKERVTKEFSKTISNAWSAEEKRKAAETLAAAAEKESEIGVKRHLLNEALKLAVSARSGSHIESINKSFIAAFESASTLPALHVQANTLQSIAAMGTPSQKLVEMVIDAMTELSLTQVQAGYPQQAETSLGKVRAILAKQTPADLERTVEAYYVQYWIARSQQARNMAPRLKSTLAAKPNDPLTNTQVAALHLSLYANLADAATCAEKSDKASFKAFAALVKPLKLSEIDIAQSDGVATSIKIGKALLDLTDECSDTFDRYAIASYVESRMEEILDVGKPQGDQKGSVEETKSRAKEIAERNKPQLPEELRRQMVREQFEERIKEFRERVGKGGWRRGGGGSGGGRGRGRS